MKMFVISDNVDTQLGMRLAGVSGVVVHETDELKDALKAACANSEIGIVLVTSKLVSQAPELIRDTKLNKHLPLVVEIPDRHGTTNIGGTISSYIREAIGIRIDENN